MREFVAVRDAGVRAEAFTSRQVTKSLSLRPGPSTHSDAAWIPAPRHASSGMLIRRLEQADWPRVSEIFSEGIATRMATFETAVPDWADWDRDHVADPRLVAVSSGLIVGWAALSRVSSRQAYRGVAEVSVYVGIYHRGQGVGRALLDRVPTAGCGRRDQPLELPG